MITGYTDNRQTTDSDEIGDPTPGVSEEHLGCLQVDFTAASRGRKTSTNEKLQCLQ